MNGCSIPLPERGVSPLSTERELNQYIFSYGNMHYAKLKSALSYLPASLFQEALEIIDWGCGQGIATITLLELKRPKNVKFTLIEPGLLALKRAALNTKCFFEAYSSGTFNCKTINKGFDDLIRSDVSTSPNRTKIHLFSNTLDIEGRYSQTELINLIKNTQSGKNYFVCCSPYINFRKKEKISNFVIFNLHLYKNQGEKYELTLEEQIKKYARKFLPLINPDFLCMVSPAEHLALPNTADIIEGTRTAKIAAHIGDLARRREDALAREAEMGEARHALDWERQYAAALFGSHAKEVHDRDGECETCSMCGDLCAIKIVEQALEKKI